MRKKLVIDSRDWFWSSARYFSGGESPIPIDPIPPEWFEVESQAARQPWCSANHSHPAEQLKQFKQFFGEDLSSVENDFL